MRIGFVTHRVTSGDGQGRVNYEVVLGALAKGHQVVLISSQAAPQLVSDERVSWVRIPVERWPSALLRNQVFAFRSASWLKKHRHELDLVLANGFITWAAADVNAVHFVHSAWLKHRSHTSRTGSGLYAWYQWLYTALNAYWERQAFKVARKLVAVSAQVRDELLEIGVSPGQIRVIPNGVDLEEFSPGRRERGAVGLPEAVTLGLFVGDIRTPRKNLDTVLRAMQRVPDLHLAVGGTTERSPYPQLAGDLGLHDRVHFLGFRSDVPDLMRAADLLVFPSRYEACSLVLLEAMASGLPIVTARTAGGAELVSDECGVVLPDPDDVDHLAQVLAELTDDAQRRQAMGKAARRTSEQYSWSRMAGRYMDLLEEVYATR